MVEQDPRKPPLDDESQIGAQTYEFKLGSQEVDWTTRKSGKLGFLTQKLLRWGVESRGILPVPLEQRTDRQFHKIFFIWLSGNVNILTFSSGAVGPIVYGLGLRETCLVVLFFNILCCIPPAYLATWGPKLGLRQMCQSRYSFGYYGVIIPCILDLVTFCGFMIALCILGGQTLSAVSDGNLSWSVGIVIIALISLFVSFCGYKILNWYERLAWVPVLLVFVIALGIGGKHLSNPPPAEPATARSIISFASTIAGFMITYSPMSSDYTTYMDANVSSYKIFTYSYLGLFLPTVTIQCLAAAFAVSATNIPAWDAASSNSVGDLIATVLSPAGGFGKFLTVLMSLSAPANIALSMYSFGLSFQVFIPSCARVPRFVFSLLATAILIPLSIIGAHRFYATLTNFLGLIGYWSSCFISVVLIEHFVFRRSGGHHRNNFTNYNLEHWDQPNKLPLGIAAVTASVLSFGLVIPSMDQVWFVGPIAKTTGDLGFEMALVVTALLYLPLRSLEIRLTGRI